MNKATAFAFALSTVLFQVFSQLALKQRVRELSGGDLDLDRASGYIATLLSDTWVQVAILSAFAGMVTWMLAIVRLPLSQAYPFVALTIPLVALLGAAIFGESVSATRLVGLGLVVLGVLLVAVS